MKTGKLLVGLIGLGILATASTASAGSVRGTGKVVYYQNGANGGSQLPLAGARVHLVDDDGAVGDDTLKTGYTDGSGNFDLSANSEDCWLCGKLDPYVIVELESNGGKLVVESEILKVNVTCATPVKDNTEGTISFGTFTCAGNNGKDATALFASLARSYNRFTQLTGQSAIPRHNGKAAALFPVVLAAGVPYTTEESIHWPGGYRKFDDLAHEFGHRIRHGQDGDFAHFLSDVASYTYLQQHKMEKVTNEGFAFNEGWAEYFNAQVNGGEDTTQLANWPMVNGGANNVEGNVAAKIHKLSGQCGGLKQMWSTLQTGGIHSYTQFSNKLKGQFTANPALKTQFPNCMPSVVAYAGPDSLGGHAHEHDLDFTKELLASNDEGIMGAVGAFAPNTDSKVASNTSSAQLSSIGDDVKARAAGRKTKNRFDGSPKLKGLGAKMASDRDAFEQRAAAKLDKHIKASKPLDGSKDAAAKREAENAALVKEILQDRIIIIEANLNAVKAEQAKYPSGDESKALAQTRTKLERVLADLKSAVQTGNVEMRHLPSSFHMATGS